MKTKRSGLVILSVGVLLFVTHEALAFYNPQTGRWLSRDPLGETTGANACALAFNDAVNEVDILGLLAAGVMSIEYTGHGSAEKNRSYWQYIVVDQDIKGQVPLNVSDSKPAASITATLDDSFDADIRAWTMLSRDKSISVLQLSTFLAGTVKACCPCPFKRIQANWSISAAIKGTAGGADAGFENNKVVTSWNKPAASRSGSIRKALDFSYCATFDFRLGQAWFDTSRSVPTVSHVNVHASFECIE